MAEYKDVCSCPSTRTPKSQPVAEQPSTRGCWNPPKKDTPGPKTKKKPHWDQRRDAVTIKLNPITTWWMTHKWENEKYQRSSLSVVKVLSPTSVFPAWGSDKRTGNAQGTWPWRPSGFDYRTYTGLGERQTPVMEGTNKISRAPRPRGKEKWPLRRLKQTYLMILEGLLWRFGLAAAAESLQSCPTLCDPIDGSPPGSPSLGFSRQEYWSGLPFLSPIHESEKWKWSRSVLSDS